MRVYQVVMRNFRGIRELDWTVGGPICCLVGPGDSCKSTILDAIELVLSPRYRLYLDDTDFYNLDVDKQIVIEATAGPVPEPLMKESRFGMCLRGWSSEDGLHDEPDGLIPVLTVRLAVGASLEPAWTVVTDREPDGRRISAADRAHFGVVGIGNAPEWQLGWRRGSILSRITGTVASLPEILARASRAARQSLSEQGEELEELQKAATRAQELGAEYGVSSHDSYRPGLDVQSATIREGGMSLHDGDVPLRRAGLGTRRLLTLSLQRGEEFGHGITLIDEVEHGLEPHRVRQLVSKLAEATGESPEAGNGEQIIMATHSSVVVEQLDASKLSVVRNTAGKVTVAGVPKRLQRVVRKASEAMLSKRILVCEGKTEPGLVLGLDRHWSNEGLTPLATCGVAMVPGGGKDSAPRDALDLVDLGYETAYFGDTDYPTNPPLGKLEEVGVKVFVWAGVTATEDRLFADLPWVGVMQLLEYAEEMHGSDRVRNALMDVNEDLILADDLQKSLESPQFRDALASASKTRAWFKRIDHGIWIGLVIGAHLHAIQGTHLGSLTGKLRDWADGNV